MNAMLHHDLPHWRFYRSLEDDLEICFKYVAPESNHFEVHSDEFAKIILLAASEFENVLKEFKFWSQISRPENLSISENILGYFDCLSSIYPQFYTMKMVMPRYSIGFTPLEDWTSKQGPDWWSQGYNKIKHDRLGNPSAPTLVRAYKAVGGLQVILLHYYKLRFRNVMMPWRISPSLIVPWDINDATHGETFAWDWTLPGENVEQQ